MPYPTTIEDYVIVVADNAVSDVQCVYCKTSVSFNQPETSNDPGDVEIQPEHNCKKMLQEEATVTLSEPVLQDASGKVLDASDFTNTVEQTEDASVTE